MSFIETAKEMISTFSCGIFTPSNSRNTDNEENIQQTDTINEETNTNKTSDKNSLQGDMVLDESISIFMEQQFHMFHVTCGSRNINDLWELDQNTNFIKEKVVTKEFKAGEKIITKLYEKKHKNTKNPLRTIKTHVSNGVGIDKEDEINKKAKEAIIYINRNNTENLTTKVKQKKENKITHLINFYEMLNNNK